MTFSSIMNLTDAQNLIFFTETNFKHFAFFNMKNIF